MGLDHEGACVLNLNQWNFVAVRYDLNGSQGTPTAVTFFVNGVKLELDLFPCFHGDFQFWTAFGCLGQDRFAFFLDFDTLVTRFYAGFQSNTVCSCTRSVTPRMTQGTTAKLQASIIAEDGNQCWHVPNVNTARCNWEYTRH